MNQKRDRVPGAWEGWAGRAARSVVASSCLSICEPVAQSIQPTGTGQQVNSKIQNPVVCCGCQRGGCLAGRLPGLIRD